MIINGLRNECVENRYHIGSWRWTLMESLKALHVIDDPREEIFKLKFLKDMEDATCDNDIVVAVKRYCYDIENFRSPFCIEDIAA
ncbi:hypothetical protein ACSFE6_04775 [Pseudomonas baetica]|uniref:hypothetical protein n=1 Tax=Pseudomonas baetica TaxID=674054 RepID=UPI003EED26D6